MHTVLKRDGFLLLPPSSYYPDFHIIFTLKCYFIFNNYFQKEKK
jgi:hypothetical protein